METIDFAEHKDCLRLANGSVDIVVTTQIGPRILRYGLLGSANAFEVIPNSLSGDTGQWRPYGGHRIWVAPETSGVSDAPDNGPIKSGPARGGLSVATPPQSPVFIGKEMTITLAPGSAAVKVEHRLWNGGGGPISAASWGLSIVANGGYVVLPHEPFVAHGADLLPARPLVLWKYTDMADERWRWGTKYITLHQKATPAPKPQKVGVYSKKGWAAHVTPDHVLVVKIPTLPKGLAVQPDQGCNFETFTDGPFQELESVGPLAVLHPGEFTSHTEFWYISPLREPILDTDEALDDRLLPIVTEADKAFQEFDA